MRRIKAFLCTTVSIVISMTTSWATAYTIDDCIKSARNGSEICDDTAFFVPAGADLVLVCLDDNGGMGYVSSNTGPVMEDGMARCQGWEEQGLNAWNHLEYVDSLVCDEPQKLIELDLPAGSKRWMGIHDYPQIGQGHFTMACLADKNGLVGGPDPEPAEEPAEEPEGPQLKSLGIVPNKGSGCATTFLAGYSHEDGAGGFRIVQLWIGTEVAIDLPSIPIGMEYGVLFAHGQSCLPGEDKVLVGEYGNLNCANSSFFDFEDERWVYYDVQFHTDTFAGEKTLFFDAKGGEGDPEPRLGWTEVGTFTVVDDPDDVSCAPDVPTHASPDEEADSSSGNGSTDETSPNGEATAGPDELATGDSAATGSSGDPESSQGSSAGFNPWTTPGRAHTPVSEGCAVTSPEGRFHGLALWLVAGCSLEGSASSGPPESVST
jgi:hypothetical protein